MAGGSLVDCIHGETTGISGGLGQGGDVKLAAHSAGGSEVPVVRRGELAGRAEGKGETEGAARANNKAHHQGQQHKRN